MFAHYLDRIRQARVYDVAEKTPLDFAANLSRRLDNRIWLKREDEQPVFSFKLRGAYNKMAQLPKEALARGVIAASAGNHAQGVALAARRLGTQATIVMPVTTPQIKMLAVRNLGGEVVLQGDNYDAAYAHARELEKTRGLTFVHPYDDPDVIAGQGTIAMELLEQAKAIDYVFVPIGGGGLVSGILTYIKQTRPEIRVIGVEPEDADSMARSLAAGGHVTLDHVGTFADGVAVRRVGDETFRIVQHFIDDIVVVSNDAICAAIKDIFEDTRAIAEPAGALAVAGAKHFIEREGLKDRDIVVLVSGANMNFDRLRHVSERAEIGERREAILAVTIPERPGSFREFCRTIGNHNITEFNYRFSDTRQAHVFVGIQVSLADRSDIDNVIAALRARGYETVDMTDNEMAKLHVRHLVGGRAPNARHEIVYRFEFPERPGALMNFLNKMQHDWNISLFHYRNHGTDFGRVLVGLQVPPEEHGALQRFLDTLGYEYAEETHNPAYRLFLA